MSLFSTTSKLSTTREIIPKSNRIGHVKANQAVNRLTPSYPRGDQRISKGALTWTSATIVTSLVFGLAIWISGNPSCSFFKVINFIVSAELCQTLHFIDQKYSSILLNQSRQSTVGWNIWNVLLDIAGGQQVLDSWSTNDWAATTGNPVKFGLGFVSIVVDTVFIVQHFVLFTERHHAMDKKQKRPLLAEDIYDLEKC